VTTVAIMQPYFVPYGGYFRLLTATDLFVVYDCVQFPRRGWVHRNRLPDATGDLRWLTLPLERAPQETLIGELRFRADAQAALREQFPRFPLLARDATGTPLHDALLDLSGTPVDYIERLLRTAATLMGIPWNSVRSSTLGIAPELHGQDRILAIAKALGATRYVNSPNGRALYEPERFARDGIELRFLSDYGGALASILARLLNEPPAAVAAEIAAESHLLP
jgi:hypothetical protein